MRDVSTTDKVGKTVHFYSRLLLLQWRNLIWPFVKCKFKKPVFILGCSRSGTTVVYKVLSMSKGLASMQRESHDFWNSLHPPEERDWDSHGLSAEDVSERDRIEVSRYFFRHVGMRRFVDKSNQNCFRIPYLLELFPDAVFIYVKRDGRDNINSLIHGWGKPDEFGAWSHTLPHDVRIDDGRYRRWAFFLFPGWRSFTNSSIEEVCARQWTEANTAVMDVRDKVLQGKLIEIAYEDILTSAVDTFREVFGRLDIAFTPDIERRCETLLEEPYNAFSTPRLDKWKQENPERIERIIPSIRKTMSLMGYGI